MSHHFPFCTNVRSWTQDDQETCLIGQIQEMLQISVACEAVDALYRFMEVPGHISVGAELRKSNNCRNRNEHGQCQQLTFG